METVHFVSSATPVEIQKHKMCWHFSWYQCIRKDSDDRGGSLCRLSKLIVLLSIGSRGHFSGQLNTVPNLFTLKFYLVSVPVIFTYNYHFGHKPFWVEASPKIWTHLLCFVLLWPSKWGVTHLNFSLHLPPTTPIWEGGPKHRTMRKKYFSGP